MYSKLGVADQGELEEPHFPVEQPVAFNIKGVDAKI